MEIEKKMFTFQLRYAFWKSLFCKGGLSIHFTFKADY